MLVQFEVAFPKKGLNLIHFLAHFSFWIFEYIFKILKYYSITGGLELLADYYRFGTVALIYVPPRLNILDMLVRLWTKGLGFIAVLLTCLGIGEN